jgi:hypothetical protein
LVQDLVIMSDSSGGVVGDFPAGGSDSGGEVAEHVARPRAITRSGPLRFFLVIGSQAGWWQDYCINTHPDGSEVLLVGQSLLVGAVVAQWD